MLPKVDPLPSTQSQRSADCWYQERCLCQCGLDVARHIIGAFVGMEETFLMKGDQPFEKEFEIMTGRGIGIFLNDETGGGVLEKKVDKLSVGMGFEYPCNKAGELV